MQEKLFMISTIVGDANSIVVVQADNPDGDSLGSALALEAILSEQGKQVLLYCGVDMPTYLRYMSGWDRVSPELPKQFDASIIVDASTMTLLDRLAETGQQSWLATKPCIVLDHHTTVENLVTFASVILNQPEKSSTGEVIYSLAQELNWVVPLDAKNFITSSILGDTQGLSNELAKADTYRVMANLVESGVNRPALEELRREFGKMQPEIYRYKAKLLQRTEFAAGGRIASVVIPQLEINTYSPLYNPAPLVQGDMLQTKGVALAIVFKTYDDGRVTAALRASHGYPIAGKLAEHMGGGGHDYASGFKDVSGKSFTDIKIKCLDYAAELLDNQINHEAV